MNIIHNPEYPLVTVITITYNSSQYVQKAIESVLNQTYSKIEYIIGDDCSTDNTWLLIQKYNDTRIKAYRNEFNYKEYPNRNKAIKMASGKYILFIDGDDVIYPHAINVFVEYAKSFPDCGVFFTKDWDHRILCPCKIYPTDIYRFEYLDRGIIGGSFTNVFFNSKILKSILLPENIATGDTYIQLKITKHHPALIIPGGLTWWRKRTGNATETFFKSNKSYSEIIKYRLDLLVDDCPLNEHEIKLAKVNLYGGCLRLILRFIIKGNIKDALFLFNSISIPYNYYYSFFIKAKYDYFNNLKGDNPLHTEIYQALK